MRNDYVSNMKRLLIFALAFLLPSAFAEISHSPDEVSEGEQFTAWIDVEEDVKSVTFYVCTLEDPHTCYKPETMDRNDSINGRFQFTYKVKSNDFPGYKYELENIIEKTARTFSLNNQNQKDNIIDAIKISCRKITKEITGKKPLTSIKLIRI